MNGLFEHWFIRGTIGFILYLLGGWSKSLEIMMTFIIVDYISGYLKSIYKKEISSKKAFRGIIKKASCILAVIIGASLDKLIEGTPINIPISLFNVPLSFKELIIFSLHKCSTSFIICCFKSINPFSLIKTSPASVRFIFINIYFNY